MRLASGFRGGTHLSFCLESLLYRVVRVHYITFLHYLCVEK